MRWSTRAHMHIDRVACAWLIRRVVDEGAEFVFVGDPAEVPRRHRLRHARGRAVASRWRLQLRDDPAPLRDHDPVLWRITEIVHEADLDDERFDAPEAPGVDVVVRALGWCATTRPCSPTHAHCSTGSTSTTAAPPCWAASPPDRSPERTCVDLEPARGIERVFTERPDDDTRLRRHAQLLIAAIPRSADTGPADDGRTSKSKIAVGR